MNYKIKGGLTAQQFDDLLAWKPGASLGNPITRKDTGVTDLLRMDHINSLPQPFVATMIGGSEWPVYDIDVGTGLLRLDVCGKLDVSHIAEVREFRDLNGAVHDPDTFYSDFVPTPPITRKDTPMETDDYGFTPGNELLDAPFDMADNGITPDAGYDYEVKSWPSFFFKMRSGEKKHDMRDKRDRAYKVGDKMLMREYDPFGAGYSGRWQVAEITYITSNDTPCAMSSAALDRNFAILSVEILEVSE